MKNLILTIAIMTFAGISNAYAHLALRSKNFAPSHQVQKSFHNRDDLKLLSRQFLKTNGKDHGLTQRDIALVIPTNMSATNNQQEVQKKIMDRTIKSIVSSKYVQNTSLAQAYKKVKDSTKIDLSVKEKKKATDNQAQAAHQEKTIEHKFKFDIRALESNATISYKGYFDTTVQYKMDEKKLAIALSEKLSEASSINFTHDNDAQGSTQWVRFQTNW